MKGQEIQHIDQEEHTSSKESIASRSSKKASTADVTDTKMKPTKRKSTKPIILPHLKSSFSIGNDVTLDDELPWTDSTEDFPPTTSSQTQMTPRLASSSRKRRIKSSFEFKQVDGEVEPEQSSPDPEDEVSDVGATSSSDEEEPIAPKAHPRRLSIKCKQYPSHMQSSVFKADKPQPLKTGKKLVLIPNEKSSKSEGQDNYDTAASTESGVELMASQLLESEEQPYRMLRKSCAHRPDSMHGVFHYPTTESLVSLSPLSAGQQSSGMHDDSFPLTPSKPSRRRPTAFGNTKLNVHGGSSVPDSNDELSVPPRSGASCASGDALSSSIWDTDSYISLFGAAIVPPPPKPRREDTQCNVFGVSASNSRNALSEPDFGLTRCQSAKPNLLDWSGTASDNVVKSRRLASTIRLLPSSTPGPHAAGLPVPRSSQNLLRENTFDNLFGGVDSVDSRPVAAIASEHSTVRFTPKTPKIIEDQVKVDGRSQECARKSFSGRRCLLTWNQVNTITGELLPYRESDEMQKVRSAWIEGHNSLLASGIGRTSSDLTSSQLPMSRSKQQGPDRPLIPN